MSNIETQVQSTENIEQRLDSLNEELTNLQEHFQTFKTLASETKYSIDIINGLKEQAEQSLSSITTSLDVINSNKLSIDEVKKKVDETSQNISTHLSEIETIRDSSLSIQEEISKQEKSIVTSIEEKTKSIFESTIQSLDEIKENNELILKKFDADINSLQEKFESFNTLATQTQDNIEIINDIREQAKQSLSETATNLDAINKNKVSVDEAKEKVDVTTEKISEHLSEIEEIRDSSLSIKQKISELEKVITNSTEETEDNAQTTLESVRQLLNEIEEKNRLADENLEAIKVLLRESKQANESTQNLAQISQSIENRITTYEEELKNLQIQSQTQLEIINGLLPGATSAGLASAFAKRGDKFLGPGKHWQWIFVISLILLIGLAATGVWHVLKDGTPLSYDELIRLWIARLPIAGALVWLALHSSREYALAKRLEEDYAYKATIASSFQGFQDQMSRISSNESADSPVRKLCKDTLKTLANPPGRIYEKHPLVVTPEPNTWDKLPNKKTNNPT